MCECELGDVRVIGYVRVEMCECEWRCASSTFVLVTSFHPCCCHRSNSCGLQAVKRVVLEFTVDSALHHNPFFCVYPV